MVFTLAPESNQNTMQKQTSYTSKHDSILQNSSSEPKSKKPFGLENQLSYLSMTEKERQARQEHLETSLVRMKELLEQETEEVIPSVGLW